MPQRVKEGLQGFLKDFPWLTSLDWLFGDCRPQAPDSNRQRAGRWNIDRYEVDVQRADATLMFRHSDVWLGADAIRDNVRGREAEQRDYTGVVKDGKLHRPEFVVGVPRNVFDRYAFQEVEYLVWITLQSWYEYERPAASGSKFLAQDPAARERNFFERVMKVTIYKPPREGWAELYRTATLSDSVLTDAYLRKGASHRYPAELAIELKLEALAKRFSADPYSKGLREQILSALEQGKPGMSSARAAITLRSYVLSGCIFINLSDRSSQVTFCGFVDEDEHLEEGLRWLGMNSWPGIYGSIPQVEQLVAGAEAAWPMPSFKPRDINGPF